MSRLKKRIIASVAVILAVAILCTTFYFDKLAATADGTLPGISEILNDKKDNSDYPFTIIEIVADMNDARIGYLIGGEEPISAGRSLYELPTKEERESAMASLGADIAAKSSVSGLLEKAFSLSEGEYTEVKSDYEGAVSVPLKGIFTKSNELGKYYYKVPQYYALDVSANDQLEYYPEKYSLYKDIDDNYKTYYDNQVSLSFKPRQGRTFTYNGESLEQYYSYSLSEKILLSDDNYSLEEMIGSRVFFISTDENGFDIFNLFGELIRNTNGDIRIKKIDGSEVNPENLEKERYAFAYFVNSGVESGDYMFADVFDVSSNDGSYHLYEHYEPNNNGHYLREKESITTIYEDWNADYTFSDPYVYKSEYLAKEEPYSLNKINDNIYFSSSFSYINGIHNNEWFKSYVMDIPAEDFSKYYFDVQTMTVDEFNKLNDISADLVFLRAGDYEKDLDVTTAQKLFIAVKEDKLPVVLESGFDNVELANNHRLSMLLEQTDIENRNWSDNLSKISSNVESHVSKSVFVINGELVSASFITEIEPKVDKDSKAFGEVYKALEFENNYRAKFGFSSLFDFSKDAISNATIVKYIINYAGRRITAKTAEEIRVLDLEPCYSFSPVYDEDKPQKDWKGDYIDEGANSLYRVHNYETHEDKVVDVINHEILTDEMVKEWTNLVINEKINIVHTYTREFIGKVEDLNENYDLIYIGLDTTTMNTKIKNLNGKTVKTTDTIYKDSSLNGLVYSHIGDEVYGADKAMYWERESTDNPKYDFSSINGKYRMSGNDITYEKYMALKEYMDAGYALVFANDFFINSSGRYSVNTNKVDPESYMCKLANYALVDGKFKWNVYREADVSGSEDFNISFNIQKLKVEFIEKPKTYNAKESDDRKKYLDNNTLFFKFKLTNNSAIEAGSYIAKLFIDTNADGRYSDLEDNSSGMVIKDERGVIVTKLSAGKTYTIEKLLPSDYIGMIPWKLQFCQEGNEKVRTAQIGYSAIKKKEDEKQEIKVLQILTNPIDPKTKGTADAVKTTVNLGDKTSTSGALFNKLKADVNDFNISLESKEVKKIIDDYKKLGITDKEKRERENVESYLSFYNQYDMLILGFADCFNFYDSNSELADYATKALAEYINNGKCVLFTHDTTSLFNFDTSLQKYKTSEYYPGNLLNQQYYVWGYFFNKNVRTVVGMDRYNILGGSILYDYYKTSGSAVNDVIDLSKFDVTTKNSATKKELNTQGYTDSELTRYNGFMSNNNNDQYGYLSTSRPKTYLNKNYNSNGQYNSGTYYVSQVNDGQITHYPFEIDKDMEIAKTHYQYYQLNMDTYSKDDIYGDDIVVWYCISDVGGMENDDMYQMNPNDVRNNYYIYNKGNVTYSGVGHSEIKNEMEMKLFINTMVAAYQASSNSPDIKAYESKDGENSIDTIYLPYDYLESDYLDEDVSFYFSVNDSSTLGRSSVINEMMLKAHYYDNSGNLQDISVALSSDDYEVYIDEEKVSFSLQNNYVDNKKITHTKAYKGLDLNKRYKLVIKKDVYQKLGDYFAENSLFKNETIDATDLAPYFSIEVHAMIENSQGGKSDWSNVSVEFRKTELFDLR